MSLYVFLWFGSMKPGGCFFIITCMFVVPVRLRPEAVKQTLNFKLDLQGHGLLVVSV